MSNKADAGLAFEPIVSPWASDAEQETFLRGETPPEIMDYLAAGISERAARQALDAGCGSETLLRLLGR